MLRRRRVAAPAGSVRVIRNAPVGRFRIQGAPEPPTSAPGPAAVPDAVAAVLGINQQPGKTVSESVAAALEGRIRLLLIDNCEHVLDAVGGHGRGDDSRSLETVRFLATSREGLVNRPGTGVAGAIVGCRAMESTPLLSHMFIEHARGNAHCPLLDGDTNEAEAGCRDYAANWTGSPSAMRIHGVAHGSR